MIADAAWSDAVLAAVTLWIGGRLLGLRGGFATGGVGLLLVGIAAVFGTLRFGGVSSLQPAHWGVTRLATLVGMPLVGAGYATAVFAPDRADEARPYVFVLLLVAAVALIDVTPYGMGIASIGMAAVVVSAIAHRDPPVMVLGIGGALGVTVAGLWIVGEGRIGPLSREAWFHLVLAASSGALGTGLARIAASRSVRGS